MDIDIKIIKQKEEIYIIKNEDLPEIKKQIEELKLVLEDGEDLPETMKIHIYDKKNKKDIIMDIRPKFYINKKEV